MASKEIILTLGDVEETLNAFEKEYRVSSVEFLSNAKLRESMSEDDVFEWEAFINHKRALQEIQAELHREYLHQLGETTTDQPARNTKLALAA